MKRALYIAGGVLLSGLAAFGAGMLALDVGLGVELATMASVAAFIGNFFMIEPIEDIIRKS